MVWITFTFWVTAGICLASQNSSHFLSFLPHLGKEAGDGYVGVIPAKRAQHFYVNIFTGKIFLNFFKQAQLLIYIE
jgi:hypothetical protein